MPKFGMETATCSIPSVIRLRTITVFRNSSLADAIGAEIHHEPALRAIRSRLTGKPSTRCGPTLEHPTMLRVADSPCPGGFQPILLPALATSRAGIQRGATDASSGDRSNVYPESEGPGINANADRRRARDCGTDFRVRCSRATCDQAVIQRRRTS